MTGLINITENIEEVNRSLDDFERQEVPFALARTLGDVAEDIRKAFVLEIDTKFDRPTPFVRNSMFVHQATKRNLTAFVQFKSGPAGTRGDKVLRPHVFGGLRNLKKHEFLLRQRGLMLSSEYAVPGQGAKLDRYGNMRGSEMNQILSAVGAQRDPLQNRTTRSARRARGGRRLRNFFVPSRTTSSLKPGVYERLRNGRIIPVLRFVSQPFYRPRLRWHDLGEEVARRNAQAHFNARLREAIAATQRRAA